MYVRAEDSVTFTHPNFRCPGSLLKTDPFGVQEITPKPKFCSLMLYHQALNGSKSKNLSKTAIFRVFLASAYSKLDCGAPNL